MSDHVTKDELAEFLQREAPDLYEKLLLKEGSKMDDFQPEVNFTFLNLYMWFNERGLVDTSNPLDDFHDVVRYYMDHVDEFHLLLL